MSPFPQVMKVYGFHQNWKADLSKRSFHMKGLTGGRKRSRKIAAQVIQKADPHCMGTAQQTEEGWIAHHQTAKCKTPMLTRLFAAELQLGRATTSTINRVGNIKPLLLADKNRPEENARFSIWILPTKWKEVLSS